MIAKARRIEQFKKVLKRCQRSAMYFIENFCQVKHPKAGIIPFKLFKYQKRSIIDFLHFRYNIYRKNRQSGISTLAGAFALWYAMFFSQKTILIVSKRDKDAKDFLNKNVKFVYRHLPKEFREIYGDPPGTFNEHEIIFPNGSSITSLTSSKDTLRSNSSSLNILDEVGFMPHMEEMWAGGQQTLMHGGSVIAISTCLTSDSMIFTNNGLIRLGQLVDEMSEQLLVETPIGMREVDKFFKYENKETIEIETKNGYSLRGTPDHHVMVFDGRVCDWKELSQVSIGDWIPLHPSEWLGNDDGTSFFNYEVPQYMEATWWPPETITEDLAYLMGLILAEGYIHKDYVTISASDRDIVGWLTTNPCGLRFAPDGDHSYRTSNRYFSSFLNQFGFKVGKGVTASDKILPTSLYRCSKSTAASFIRGFADGDGHARTRDGEVGFTSTSLEVINGLRQALLGFGIFCNKLHEIDEQEREFPDGSLRQCKKAYQLTVNAEYNDSYYEQIGFGLQRKHILYKARKRTRKLPVRDLCLELYRSRRVSQSRLKSVYGLRTCNLFFAKQKDSLSPETVLKFLKIQEYKDLPEYATLSRIMMSNCKWTKVAKIIPKEKSTVYDIRVPDGNCYIANGFLSHNCNGVGNWYHTTWVDAIAERNEFHPIQLHWWDMDWKIKYRDEFTGRVCEISPTKGLRKCESKEDKDKWGQYYSPWLEEQYRALQQRGEAHLFRQEVLAEFIGSGNTVLSREQLIHVNEGLKHKYWTVGIVDNYTHPVTEQNIPLDFEHQLYVWKKPVRPEPDVIENGRVIRPGAPGHTYSMGVDISTGEADDYDAIQVVDCVTHEQVAELFIKVPPSVLLMMVDYLGRWYNGAYIVPERQGVGQPTCHALYHDMAYTNVYRMKTPAGTPTRKVGFPTNPTHKPTINKALIDHIGEDGVHVYGSRTYEQLTIYVHLGTTPSGQTKTGHVEGPGNHSDLTIALGLALIGMKEAVQADHSSLIPAASRSIDQPPDPVVARKDNEKINSIIATGGVQALAPIAVSSSSGPMNASPQDQVLEFARQIGALPTNTQLNPLFQRKPPTIDYPRRGTR